MNQLKDIYYAEKEIIKTLPKMAGAASQSSLKKAFERHLEESERHIERLEQVFEMMGEKASGKKCEAIEGIIDEGKEFIKNGKKFNPDVNDAGLIAAAQRVEHYEIAVYGTLRAFAEHLGQEHAAELLQRTLNEEKQADEKLTGIAGSTINEKAADA
jgi:ferritin-like metal-binding protein YciE